MKKIESHPHREALQADLQQNNVYNPFSDDSKAMIREMLNLELCELCQTIPKVQCSECLLCWNQGIIYCICGHLLVESEPPKMFTSGDWMLSRSRTTSPERRHLVVLGTAKLRHRKSISWTTTRGKRYVEKNFDGIHDHFQRDSENRDSQLHIGWTEEKCIEMDKLAKEDNSCCPSSEECKKYKNNGLFH